MIDNRFTVGQAAEYIGMPKDTLRTWIYRKWVDAVRSYQSKNLKEGLWDRLTARELVSLRLVKEFARGLPIPTAAEIVAGCEPAIIEYLFNGVDSANRRAYRFIGVQIVTCDGKTYYAPHYGPSLASFETAESIAPAGSPGSPHTYHIFDLAMFPIPSLGNTSDEGE